MLFRHIRFSLLTSPKFSTINGLEFNFALVSANNVLQDSSFKILPYVNSKSASPKLLPYDLANSNCMTSYRISMPSDVVRTKIF